MTVCHRIYRALLPRHCAYQGKRALLLLSYAHLY
nr:unnamed protein product [Callosobruchus chinensis]